MRKKPTDSQQKGLHRCWALVEAELRDVTNAIEAIEPGPHMDRCLLKQHKEQISSLKSELTAVLHKIGILDEENSSLVDKRSVILKVTSSTRLQIR